MQSNAVATDWMHGKLEYVGCCPMCGSSQRTPHAEHVADHLKADPADFWDVWRCTNCQSLYPDPRPDPSSLAMAYESYYTHAAEPGRPRGANGIQRIAERLVNGYMNARFNVSLQPASKFGHWIISAFEPFRLKLDYHGRHLYLIEASDSRRSVLDIGCGNGEFLKRAAALGFDAVGLDPDPGAVTACRDAGCVAFEGFISNMPHAARRRYDVITLRHSIEHTADPVAQIRECARWLKPGGLLWLAWPNPAGPGSKAFGAAWRGLEVPRHLVIPDGKTMLRYLRSAGFESVRMMRRGHHARNIMLESAHIARQRGDSSFRSWRYYAKYLALRANCRATYLRLGGDELVVTARMPRGTEEQIDD